MADNTFTGDYNPANLPFSAEAEQAVLGAIIIDNAMFDNVLDYVKSADYFYISLHKIIFEAMQEMMNFGRAIDFVTLLDILKQNSAFEEATGKPYLVDLVNNCPAPSNAAAYAQIVADKYKLRRLITASREIIDDATAAADDRPLTVSIRSTATRTRACALSAPASAIWTGSSPDSTAAT